MSTLNIVGIKPPDEKWLKMKEVYDSCNKAGVDILVAGTTIFDSQDPKQMIADLKKAG